ncbi:clusterin-like protein 1 [Stigmatopora nigra]
MKIALILHVLTTLGTIISGASDNANPSDDALKELSEAGEKAVGEEVKRALYGVGQMKDVMWKNQRKHEHLIKSLLHSGEKKKGAAQLAQDVTEKLQEAEDQCRTSLQSEWEECRPCLEDACKTFFTNTCRRGFATFQTKVENFFRRVSRRFSFGEPTVETNPGVDDSDAEVVRIQDAFARLSRKVETLANSSAALASKMSDGLDQALRRALLGGPLHPSETQDPNDPARDSGYLQGVGLEEVLESFFDFGRSVVQEFGAVVTQAFDGIQGPQGEDRKTAEKLFPRLLRNRQLCRDLRKQSSECWQLQNQCEACQGSLLTACPSVRELQVELEHASQLLGVSREQYDEVLSIARRHADETLNWLGNMAAEFGWVARANTPSLFRIIGVAPKGQDQNLSEKDTQVEVTILDSAPFFFSVPGELELQDPAFVQFVAQEALDRYKGMVRYEEDE